MISILIPETTMFKGLFLLFEYNLSLTLDSPLQICLFRLIIHFLRSDLNNALFRPVTTHKRMCLNSIKQWSERFSCWTKSKPSYINRLKGKGLSCIIDVLRKPPIKLEGKSIGTSTSCVS